MAYRFFTIPLAQPETAEADLNRFLASAKISGVEKHFVSDGANSCWAVAVQYATGATPPSADSNRTRIDYREVLPPEQFTIYDRLRSLRSELASSEGVKLHAILTNEQLAAIVTAAPRNLEDLAKIPGIGEKRLKQETRPDRRRVRSGAFGRASSSGSAPGCVRAAVVAGGFESTFPGAADRSCAWGNGRRPRTG